MYYGSAQDIPKHLYRFVLSSIWTTKKEESLPRLYFYIKQHPGVFPRPTILLVLWENISWHAFHLCPLALSQVTPTHSSEIRAGEGALPVSCLHGCSLLWMLVPVYNTAAHNSGPADLTAIVWSRAHLSYWYRHHLCLWVP